MFEENTEVQSFQKKIIADESKTTTTKTTTRTTTSETFLPRFSTRKIKTSRNSHDIVFEIRNESLEIGENLFKKSLIEQNSTLIYIIILLSGLIFFLALCTVQIKLIYKLPVLIKFCFVFML